MRLFAAFLVSPFVGGFCSGFLTELVFFIAKYGFLRFEFCLENALTFTIFTVFFSYMSLVLAIPIYILIYIILPKTKFDHFLSYIILGTLIGILLGRLMFRYDFFVEITAGLSGLFSTIVFWHIAIYKKPKTTAQDLA